MVQILVSVCCFPQSEHINIKNTCQWLYWGYFINISKMPKNSCSFYLSHLLFLFVLLVLVFVLVCVPVLVRDDNNTDV